ncbi:MAG: pentapeptide repeat-containing protein [Rivularia sp. (in: cyanobacteria)]
MKTLVNLEFSDGDFHLGFGDNKFQVKTAAMRGNSKQLTITLPPAPGIPSTYEKWKQVYDWLTSPERITKRKATRGGFKKTQTNFSPSECNKLARNLHEELNQWLSPLQLQLNSVCKLNPDSEIHLLINTKKIVSEATKDILHKLPWHELDYFLETNSLEAAICFNELKSNSPILQPEEKYIRRARVISIFGDSSNIDTKADETILNKLKQRGGELIVLQQPQRPDLVKLWDEPCDILFYGGHSDSRDYQTGVIYINQDDYLDLQEIRKTLRASVNKGLKLAIFNSCDGLGLARQLADLNLPYVIVWREPVPDEIAQKFLEYFLNSFTEGKSLFKSVREARDKLQELTKNTDIEKQIPGVSWLPIICQNTVDAPPTWKEMGGLTGKVPNCPYKGLSAFREEDADFFFGRDEFVGKLLKAVNSKSLVPVVGASGSGKSSVVFAGLVPELRKNGNVQIVSFRPGDNPFDSLAVALKQFAVASTNSIQENADKERLEELELGIDLRNDKKALCILLKNIATLTLKTDNNPRFIIIADQFEELYTLTPSEQRQSFLDALLYAVKFTPLFTLILTMRADFYGKAIAYRPFSDALQEGVYNLAPMNYEELESAIAKPAQAMKVDLEEGLTSRLIKDVANQPGLLPLLQFALTQLWDKQKNWFLTHQAYEEIGGIEKALANHADAVFHKLSAADKKRVERIFIQLVRLGEGVEDTRRVATRVEVGEENWDLVDYLAGEKVRLLVTGRDEVIGKETVEIVHEALIGNWLLLREWVDKIREQLKFKQRIEDAAVEWERRKKEKDYLLGGKLLKEAREFQKQTIHNVALSKLAIKLVKESVKKRRNNRIKTVGFGLIIPGVLAVFLGFEGVKQVKIRRLWDTVEAANGEEVSFVRNRALEELMEIGANLKGIPLENADLSNINFSNAELGGAELSGAKLGGAKLSNANLRGADLRNVNLVSANLEDADLEGADLRNANLVSANLEDADLEGADLRKVNLVSANLEGADLRNTNLNGIDLSRVNLGVFGVNFGGANLSGTNLSGISLNSVNLSGANLRNANLSGTSITGANLRNVNLRDADLRNAYLRTSNLGNADLRNADLRNANIGYAYLRDADLSGAKLKGAIINFTQIDARWYLVWEIINQGGSKKDLSSANLSNADLSNTDLSNANLSNADLSGTELNNANLSGTNLRDANLGNSNLSNTNLGNADLSFANLNFANLSSINLSNAVLSFANLSDADLYNSKNITIKQIKSAKNWEQAKYDQEFRAKLGLPLEK